MNFATEHNDQREKLADEIVKLVSQERHNDREHSARAELFALLIEEMSTALDLFNEDAFVRALYTRFDVDTLDTLLLSASHATYLLARAISAVK